MKNYALMIIRTLFSATLIKYEANPEYAIKSY